MTPVVVTWRPGRIPASWLELRVERCGSVRSPRIRVAAVTPAGRQVYSREGQPGGWPRLVHEVSAWIRGRDCVEVSA